MRHYIKLSNMTQDQRARYQAKRKRINEKRTDKEQRRNYVRHGASWSLDPATCEHIPVDGEATDAGEYNLFQGYTPLLPLQSLDAGDTGRLGLLEVARFLIKLRGRVRRKSGKRVKFYYFAGGYDIAQQLWGDREIPNDAKMAIWKQRSRAWGSVRGPHFSPEIDVPEAGVSVQNGRKSGHIQFHREGRRDIRVSWEDIFSLFGQGLVPTLEGYAKFWTAEEHATLDAALDAVKLGKEARGRFAEMGYTPEQIAKVYQEPELKLMYWLVNKVLALCKEVELYPRSLAGPAPLARSLMQKYGVVGHIKPTDYDTDEFQSGPINTIIRHAFFGGNIQCAISGKLPDGYHTLDINSAYPYQMSRLPCGAHGYFRELTPEELTGPILPYSILHIRWKCPRDTVWPPFPVRRRNHSIVYPLAGEGWYCWEEVQAFIDCFDKAEFRRLAGIIWIPTCDHEHPFETMVKDTYTQRNVYKKTKNPAGNILKLALNSQYGVTAQTSGSYRMVDEDGNTVGWHTPRMSNLFLAALITSGCRAQIMRMIAVNPKNVFAVATDAIKCYDTMNLPAVEADDKETDRPLGGLEHERHTGSAIVSSPGFIGHAEGGDKIRGVPAKSMWRVGNRTAESLYDAQLSAINSGATEIAAQYDKFQSPFDAGSDATAWGRFIPTERRINITPHALHVKRNEKCAILLAEQLWYCPPYSSSIDGASQVYMRPMDHASIEGLHYRDRPERMESG